MKVCCPRCGYALQSPGAVEESPLEYATLSLCAQCGFGLDLRWRGRGSARMKPVPHVLLVTTIEGLAEQLSAQLPVSLESTPSSLEALGQYARALSLGAQVQALLLTNTSPAQGWAELALSVRSLEEGFGVTTPTLLCVVTNEQPTAQERQELSQMSNIYWIPCEVGQEAQQLISMATQLFAPAP